jgi:hypothetical protein
MPIVNEMDIAVRFVSQRESDINKSILLWNLLFISKKSIVLLNEFYILYRFHMGVCYVSVS